MEKSSAAAEEAARIALGRSLAVELAVLRLKALGANESAKLTMLEVERLRAELERLHLLLAGEHPNAPPGSSTSYAAGS